MILAFTQAQPWALPVILHSKGLIGLAEPLPRQRASQEELQPQIL